MHFSPSRCGEFERAGERDDILPFRRLVPVECRVRRRLLEVHGDGVGTLIEIQRAANQMRGIVRAGEEFECVHRLIALQRSLGAGPAGLQLCEFATGAQFIDGRIYRVAQVGAVRRKRDPEVFVGRLLHDHRQIGASPLSATRSLETI